MNSNRAETLNGLRRWVLDLSSGGEKHKQPQKGLPMRMVRGDSTG